MDAIVSNFLVLKEISKLGVFATKFSKLIFKPFQILNNASDEFFQALMLKM